MADEPAPARRQRRRRRAVWRPGEGISRSSAEPQSQSQPQSRDDAARTPERPVPGPANGGREPPPAPARPPAKRRRSDSGERGLRELVGAGPSQLDPARAMRARDANRPSEEDLARAEQEVVIVRRHWKPPKS